MGTQHHITSNINIDEAILTPWVGRAIIHLDLDAFFAAVHVLDDPSLQGLPIIVGGSPDGRGVVSTASYEARVFGVHSAMPSRRAAQLCPNAVWIHPDMTRYKEVAHDVMAIVESYTPLVERTSIDEAYADISPSRFIEDHPITIARSIIERVSLLGVTCSIGLSTSKTISKIGSDFIKPRGLTVVRAGDEAAFTSKMDIKKLKGVGPSTVKKLYAVGIKTLGDLAGMDKKDAKQLLGNVGPIFVDRAAGKDSSKIICDADTKSISSEHTFTVDLADPKKILASLHALCEKVGWRLRKDGLYGRTVTVKIRYGDFSTHTVSKTLADATSDEQDFYPVVKKLVVDSGSLGRDVRLLGVGMSNFAKPSEQLSLDNLFMDDGPSTTETRKKREGLIKQVDEIRSKFGYGVIGSGSQLPRAGDEDT